MLLGDLGAGSPTTRRAKGSGGWPGDDRGRPSSLRPGKGWDAPGRRPKTRKAAARAALLRERKFVQKGSLSNGPGAGASPRAASVTGSFSLSAISHQSKASTERGRLIPIPTLYSGFGAVAVTSSAGNFLIRRLAARFVEGDRALRFAPNSHDFRQKSRPKGAAR